MKKVILLAASFLLSGVTVFAQSIPYQAMARDTTGTPIPNQHMNARMTIYSGGTTVYQETDSFTTSNLGMFTINVGQGTVDSGTFSAIDWSSGLKYLKVELDPTGGTSFISMGVTQLLDVPFALYALQSGTSSPPTGTAKGIPYFNQGGVLRSDSLFTRDSTLATRIFRTEEPGSITEGLSLGTAMGGVVPDGVFLTRFDTAASHFDLIGEGNLSDMVGLPNGIGILCTHGTDGHGPQAFIMLVDSNPTNSTVYIGSQNGFVSSYKSTLEMAPDTIYLIEYNNDNNQIGFLIDTVTVHIESNGTTWNWPTADGTSGQVLKTDGSGNLSWTNAGGGSGWSLSGNSGLTLGQYLGTSDGSTLNIEANNNSLIALSSNSSPGPPPFTSYLVQIGEGIGTLQYQDAANTWGAGNVLTSDASGNASWQPPFTATGIVATSSTPSIAASSGAGTSPTVSIIGTNIGGLISVTEDVSGATGAVLVTVSYASLSYPTGSYVVLYPANAATAALTGSSAVYASGTTTAFTITTGSTALTASTVYAWNYVVVGN